VVVMLPSAVPRPAARRRVKGGSRVGGRRYGPASSRETATMNAGCGVRDSVGDCVLAEDVLLGVGCPMSYVGSAQVGEGRGRAPSSSSVRTGDQANAFGFEQTPPSEDASALTVCVCPTQPDCSGFTARCD